MKVHLYKFSLRMRHAYLKQEDLHDSPFITCMSRRAQSGRRISFGSRVWFIESHLVLDIFLLIDLFIHLLSI